MDKKLTSYTDSNNQFFVDYQVDSNGCVPIITGEEEQLQNAQMAAYIQKDAIPQLVGNGHGVDWPGFLSGKTGFGEIDAQIRDNLTYAGLSDLYAPFYAIENEKLKTTVRKQ
jgi:hypothetical protein